jgi:hypothetical protein
MKYNDKDTLQDHVLAVAGGILNIAMLFSAQFPASSVQFTDLRKFRLGTRRTRHKSSHTRLRFRFMGCGCNRCRRPKGWGPRVYREGNRTNRDDAPTGTHDSRATDIWSKVCKIYKYLEGGAYNGYTFDSLVSKIKFESKLFQNFEFEKFGEIENKSTNTVKLKSRVLGELQVFGQVRNLMKPFL